MPNEPSLLLRVIFGAEVLCWGAFFLMLISNLVKGRAAMREMAVISLVLAAPFLICSVLGALHGRGVVSGLTEGWLSWGAVLTGLAFRPLLWLLLLIFGLGITR